MALPAYAEQNTVTINPDATASGCGDTQTCYTPYNATIRAGGVLYWSNTDNTAHTVVSGTSSEPDAIFASGLIKAGDSYAFVFEDKGTYDYFCMLHPWMTGRVTVSDADASQGQKLQDTRPCKNLRSFFLQGMISEPVFEDFEGYCRYAKASQDDVFSYDVSVAKKPERAMYGISFDDAKGEQSLVALLSVKREYAKNGSTTSIGAANHGSINVASFDSALVNLSFDVYATNLNPGGSPAAGARSIIGITYHTASGDGEKAIEIVSHYSGDYHGGSYISDIPTVRLFADEKRSQNGWKHIEHDVMRLYNENDLGNYASDVTHWTLSVGGWAYTSNMHINSSWQVNLDNLVVHGGENHPASMPSIAHQLAVGVLPHNVACSDGRKPALRISDSKPLCLLDSSIEKIFELRYAVPIDTKNNNILEQIASEKKNFGSYMSKHINEDESVTSTYSISDVLNHIDNTEKKRQLLSKIKYIPSSMSLDSMVFERGGWSGDESGGFMAASMPQSSSGVSFMSSGRESAGLQFTDAPGVFSTTNIHVLGVDEPDFVKNNAQSIYVLSHENDIAVINAQTPEALQLLSETSPHTDDARYLMLHQDSLVILSDVMGGTEITVLDVTVSPPAKTYQLTLDAPLYKARMINDTLYVMTQTAISDTTQPPLLYDKTNSEVLSLRPMVHYFADNLESDTLHTITAINMHKDRLEAGSGSFVLGASDVVYVSKDNIYLTYVQNYSDELSAIFENGMLFDYIAEHMDIYDLVNLYRIAPGIKDDAATKGEMLSLSFSVIEKQDMDDLHDYIGIDQYLLDDTPQTIIHKISVDKTDIEHVASSSVKGTLLNQFAVDQKDDDTLRVATSYRQDRVLQSNVYVLDDTLKLVGSLEGIAPGETLHSTRFAEDWLYMVTFRQIDPFFVIDVSTNTPKILGELKIPGYSEYLQRYDDGHVIGIGRDTNRNAWDQATDAGIKISMFDVTDFGNPRETDNVIIGNHAADSAGLVEHKSLLIDDVKKIVSIPVRFGSELFFYLYTVGDDYTLSEHSVIPHKIDFEHPQHMRSLYIGDTLYTVTPAMVKANSLMQHDHSFDAVQLGLD